MPTIPPRPLLILARLDSDNVLRWWLKREDGLYEPWPLDGELTIVLSREVGAVGGHRLIPAVVDFEQPRGDQAAIIECHNARDKWLGVSRA